MSNHPQAVVLGDRIYMGGGFATSEHVAKILEFDPCNEEWKELEKQCPTKYFGMAVIKRKLFVVAGTELSSCAKNGRVYSWDFESKKWNPYPCTSMLTYRSTPSIVSYSEKWLIALGGEDKHCQILDSVERLNIENPENKCHWLYSPKLPVKCAHFSSTVVGDKLFTFGTTTYGATSSVGMPSNSVFYAPLDDLVSPNANADSVWQEIKHLPLKASIAVTFNGSLLALGGIQKDSIRKASPCIFKLEYDRNSDQESPSPVWKKAGDLPCSLYQCAGTQIHNNIFIHGISSEVSETRVYMYTL